MSRHEGLKGGRMDENMGVTRADETKSVAKKKDVFATLVSVWAVARYV